MVKRAPLPAEKKPTPPVLTLTIRNMPAPSLRVRVQLSSGTLHSSWNTETKNGTIRIQHPGHTGKVKLTVRAEYGTLPKDVRYCEWEREIQLTKTGGTATLLWMTLALPTKLDLPKKLGE